MQIVGRNCGVCDGWIGDEIGARFCHECGCPVHHACWGHPSTDTEARCSVCGSKASHPLSKTSVEQKNAEREAQIRQSLADARAEKRDWRAQVQMVCTLLIFIPIIQGFFTTVDPLKLLFRSVLVSIGIVGSVLLETRYKRKK